MRHVSLAFAAVRAVSVRHAARGRHFAQRGSPLCSSSVTAALGAEPDAVAFETSLGAANAADGDADDDVLLDDDDSTFGTDYHIPVMLKEVCEWLVTEKDGLYVDGTLGGGGHSAALLAALKNLGRVVGVDQDADAIATATARIASDRFRAVRSNFDGGIEAACGGELADGVLLDLGVSSHQLDAAARGFSLRFDGPLDMRMNAEASSLTAHDVVNTYEERALKDLIRAGSDEAHAGRIAKAIIAARPLERTTQLATVIAAAVPYKKKISPVADEMMRKKTVARVFQAIRIRVNDEFGALERTLLALPSFVKPGGRVVVLAYHSLEDRRVKRILRSGSLSGECPTDVFGNRLSPWKVIARGALTPSEAELERNGRARSVRMRVAERTDFVPNDDPNGRDMRIVAARIRTAMR